MAQDIEPETHLVAERETEYTGPVKITSLKFGGHTIQVVRPADPDRLLDDPLVRHWNERDDYMPYWAYLWPGALFLAEAVAREPWPLGTTLAPPLRALEIGCGVGLAGLVAVSRGLSVRFTDYDHAPLHFVRRSAQENGFDPASYSTRLLDWRNLPDESYPVILGSDVLYDAGLSPLWRTCWPNSSSPAAWAWSLAPAGVRPRGLVRSSTPSACAARPRRSNPAPRTASASWGLFTGCNGW